jgi:monoamine oxidase
MAAEMLDEVDTDSETDMSISDMSVTSPEPAMECTTSHSTHISDGHGTNIARVDTHSMKIDDERPSPFQSNDSTIKSEDDDDSYGGGAQLRSLQLEDGSRDSPNGSMTSASLMSSTHDARSPPTPKSVKKEADAMEDLSAFRLPKSYTKYRARSSVPSRMHPAEYARQCVDAAVSSRLDPYALHLDEHRILQHALCHSHVTVYLNIRNGILRLWVRNPGVSVNLEEAVGCAKDQRWFGLACFAYEWLVRKGYINFGCVEASFDNKPTKGRRKEIPRETIVVIGGGMAGLSCARQLTNLFQHYPNHPTPKVVVLEGRNRIGGRIYSHPLSSMRSSNLQPHERSTAEMGAHIIIGFDHGNPLDAIVRGQLALNYHSLRDLSTLYDIDGSPVNENQDTMVERLYNDVLDRSMQFRIKGQKKKTAEGDKELIDSGRDPAGEDGLTISQYEEATASGTIDLLLPSKSRRRGAGHKAAKSNKPTEEVDTNTESQTQLTAAEAAEQMGFHVKDAAKMNHSLQLHDIATIPNQSLGAVMNEGVRQYQEFLELRPKALRLLNWHYANLEYANACNVDKLSLGSWDQDIGNEFEGEHAQVIGGYQQVPRALWRYPEVLDVRKNKVVKKIKYGSTPKHQKTTITCEDGEVFEADKVILTAPLGVLKQQSIEFDPPLPDWKQGAISRLGFGLLNKLVLVFEKPFWDLSRDMFGLLRAPKSGSGIRQEDYSANRGQFYLFWNCVKTTGLPVLIALMAGDAAHEAERTNDRELISQCLSQLRNVFGNKVTDPVETIVTRWGSDRFARGTYSYVAAGARPGDYDLVGQPVDNIHFAGEATWANHPATVHGAYLSGLRAASEVLDSIIGPIQLTQPLVPAAGKIKRHSIDRVDSISSSTSNTQKRKGDPVIPAGTFTRPVKETVSSEVKAMQDAWDAAMWVRIYDDLGPPPTKPPKSGLNPFLLYQKEHWNAVKDRLDQAKQRSSGKAGAKAGRDEVRIELGKMWKALDEEGKKPFLDETQKNKAENIEKWKEYAVKAAEWDRRTWEVKAVWISEGNSFEEFCERQRQDDIAMGIDLSKKAKISA